MDNNTNIKGVLSNMLRRYGLEERYFEYELLRVWEEILGKMIARHTTDLKLKNKILSVTLDSSPLKQELTMMKTELISRLNECFEKNIINDIKIR